MHGNEKAARGVLLFGAFFQKDEYQDFNVAKASGYCDRPGSAAPSSGRAFSFSKTV
jgi:hypothetical protein